MFGWRKESLFNLLIDVIRLLGQLNAHMGVSCGEFRVRVNNRDNNVDNLWFTRVCYGF